MELNLLNHYLSLEHFHHPKKEGIHPVAVTPHSFFPSAHSNYSFILCMDLPLLDIVWKNNHICGLLCLSFTWHKVFKILSCCSIYEYFIPFYD